MTAFEATTLLKKFKRIIRQIIYSGILIVGVSEAVTNDLRQFFPHCTCECIVNSIDFDHFRSMSSDLPSGVSLDKNQFNVLIHGTHFLRKGVDLAIKVIDEINSTNFPCKLFVTTNAPEESLNLIHTYSQNPKNVQIIEPVENIKALYDSVDLFISPSRLEAFGYAVVEAAFSNCQVIASDTPGQNTMKDIPGIMWVEVDDIEGLHNAILQAYHNQESYSVDQIKNLQKAFVEEHYDIQLWVEQVIALYSKYNF